MYTATIFPTVKRYEHLLLTIVNMFKRVFILRNVKCVCIKYLSLGDPTEGSGAISYTVKIGSEDFIAVDSTTGALTIKKVPSDGRTYVIVTAAGTDTCVEATKDVTVTINKANAAPATVTANNRTYDGTDKPLVTVTGAATGGEMQYAIGTAAEATQPYTTSIPTATNAGTYYVWYKVKGDANHTNTEPFCIEVLISLYSYISGGESTWTKSSGLPLIFQIKNSVDDSKTFSIFRERRLMANN